MSVEETLCRFTPDPVCPYCGAAHDDFCDVNADSGDFQCHTCGRTFFFERHIEVTYNTSPTMGPHQQSEWDRKCEQEYLDDQRQRS